MRDNNMVGPGLHENAAQEAMYDSKTEDAQIHALLAIASAVNRLAEAMENLVAAQE